MAQTGKERSLTVKISKTKSGIIQPGYPITYQGRNSFAFNNVSYPVIDVFAMSSMSEADYNIRLEAFKSYVQTQESGLNFSTDLIAGNTPYHENLTSCPIQN